jgi:hypothetical protein
MSRSGERHNLVSDIEFWNTVIKQRRLQMEGARRLREAAIRELRELDAEIRMEAAAQPAPRYDDVYHEGVAALDAMARGEGDE